MDGIHVSTSGTLRRVSTLTLSRAEVDALAEQFEGGSAQELLEWAVDRFAGRIVLTCSWQQQSSILVDMLHTLGADIRIVELDTGLLFPETYETRNRLIERYGLQIERIDPRQSVEEQELTEGPALWSRDPDRCCALRKVEPLERALVGMDAWITGIRRAQSPTRANARMLEIDPRGVVKVQPLAAWSDEDCKGYLFAHDVPYNPLHDRGFPSIGCTHCTRAIRPGEDSRAGRWADAEKTECGLHTPAQDASSTTPNR
jgi:phosphoadenosine phosphosulfate reductase